MTKTKRSELAFDMEDDSYTEEQENLKRASSLIRSCTGSPAPETDAINFLANNNLTLLAQAGGERRFWVCVAELNVLLRAFQHTFTELQLLCDPRCFVRSSKPSAFERVAWAHGCTGAEQLQQHAHLLALRAVLELACADCSEVCISELSFAAPPWLDTWARKWLCSGGGSAGSSSMQRISLTVVQGYQSAAAAPLRASAVYNIGCPVMTTAAPCRTIYLPCIL